MCKSLALILLLIFSIVEVLLGVYMFTYGLRAAGLPVFIFFLWNLSACIAMLVYILSKGASQNDGYIDVSNYLNLNKIANKEKL